MKKNMYKIPKNTVRVITNVEGEYEVADYDLKSLASSETPMIAVPVSEDMVPGCAELVTPGVHVAAEPLKSSIKNGIDKDLVDPFIPYAMSTDPDHFMKPCTLGIADLAPGKRMVTVDYGDGKNLPMTESAIIGDDYGPVGLFVPFCASPDAIYDASELLTDVYNSYNTRANSRDVFYDNILGPRPDCNCKKLPF